MRAFVKPCIQIDNFIVKSMLIFKNCIIEIVDDGFNYFGMTWFWPKDRYIVILDNLPEEERKKYESIATKDYTKDESWFVGVIKT